MIYGKTISLVIPCKNEARSLPKLLKRVPSFVDEVIIVDNNSSDTTVSVAKNLGCKVRSEKRTDQSGIGYGFAHQTGLKIASGDIVVTMDGDGTYPIEQIREVLKFMTKNQLDFVSCNRFPLLNSEAVSAVRKLGVLILNTQVSLLFSHPIKDILSGMWAVNRGVAKKLQLQEGGWNLSPEIKLKALLHKEIAFSEYHIMHHYRSHGDSKQQIWKTGFEHLRYIAFFRAILFLKELKQKSKGQVLRYSDAFPAITIE